jgi:hypothetical protein
MCANLATSPAVHAQHPETLHVVHVLQDTILSGWVSLANSIATMASMVTPSRICVSYATTPA